MADGGFWKTAPGMITAVAAIITAIGGLIGVLIQTGVIGADRKDATPTQTTQVRSAPPTAITTAAGVASEAKPWRDVEATITAGDGTQVKARADAVRFCFSGGAGVNLDDRQDIAFEKMSAIEVLRSDVALSAGGRATVRITLASGATREGTITSGCDFFAQTEEGRYSLYPDKLKKIEFQR